MEYSTLLKKNLKIFYNKNNKNSFELLEGCGSVIVSAPHSVEQIRNGKIKFAEYQTGAITRILHEKIGCRSSIKQKIATMMQIMMIKVITEIFSYNI